MRPARPRRRWLALLLALGISALLVVPQALAALAQPGPPPPTSYDLAWQAPFNRPEHYPLERRPDPALYRPHGDWFGRLILPPSAEMAEGDGDWVWLEVEQAPAGRQDLIGRRLRLGWQDDPRLRVLVGMVRTPVRLGAEARLAAQQGNVVPTRLDGRDGVGPLQSLAGAHPHDDITVTLEAVQLEQRDGEPMLRIGRPPLQSTGRWVGLVRLLSRDPADPERFQVQHYDRRRGSFSGVIETMRLPRQPPDRHGRRFFDPEGLLATPAGADGWYVYGAPDGDGTFTAQALEPRLLTALASDRLLRGTTAGLNQISRVNWSDSQTRRGRFSRVGLIPDGAHAPWQPGDRSLLIHNFGGIGGSEGEAISAFTVTGHFAFGAARVVIDPFTGQPRFDLRYHQIYANNPNGIVSGSQDWSAYTGNLQRGWLGTRPISDVLVRTDPLLLDELAIQAEVLMARYRSGDGGGVSLVTPAISCVQDSSQALWIAIDQLRRRRRELDGRELPRLASLAQALDALLTPFGMVREDWRHNASLLDTPGEAPDRFKASRSLWDGVLSWRSMLPRRAHDEMAGVFLRHGDRLHLVRTNQLPGADQRLAPLAPTQLLGQFPVVGVVLPRLMDSYFAPLTSRMLAVGTLLLGIYAAVALGLGRGTGFLPAQRPKVRPMILRRQAVALLLTPSLIEETLFRAALLPHPLEGLSAWDNLAWGALSVGLFVAWHPLAGRLWYPQGRRLFDDGRFLLLAGLLGVVCVIAYQATGSIWPPVLIHWLVVLIWLELLGGRWRLGQEVQG
ncbi:MULTISPECIES: type II CAAX prenyl endopeptidase Rce1 family protein [unclassified Cyanobium]|uniref:CPBP family glutamic-type intramembrane protease n=1 Tax=unclassified Cyanobium TaxID=2627006 RepID=UPI0020CFD9CC|nr:MULTISPECIES: CPBP family glutamic-type intramembrane protease [unclassified Cyanobium]